MTSPASRSRTTMGNERLRSAMAAAHKTVEDVAGSVDVDPKTVQRWLSGRLPYPRHRWAVAAFLGEDERWLWPSDGAGATLNGLEELVGAYPNRAAVPPRSWWRLLVAAERQIDLLGYAMLHLPEQHPDLMPVLKEKAGNGCGVRIALVDPTCPAAQQRDAEEGLDGGLTARIKTARIYFGELRGLAGIELRQHRSPLYNSIFRFDEDLYVTPHLYGVPGSKAPLFHLRRRGPVGVFQKFADHFETVWTTAKPIPLEAV